MKFSLIDSRHHYSHTCGVKKVDAVVKRRIGDGGRQSGGCGLTAGGVSHFPESVTNPALSEAKHAAFMHGRHHRVSSALRMRA